MDQPQHQVFGANPQSYRFMGYPLQQQKLQLLYPGRLMERNWDFTGDNIPNEDPEGLERTRNQNSALAKAAKMEMEAMERHLGGKHKVVNHPAVEPEAMIEDPALIGLDMKQGAQAGPDLEVIKSPTFKQTLDKVYGDVLDVRSKEAALAREYPLSQQQIAEMSPTTKGTEFAQTPEERIQVLPRYNFRENFESDTKGTETATPSKKVSGATIGPVQPSTPHYGWGIALGALGILVVALIALLVYGMKTSSDSKPTYYTVVHPEFLGPGMKGTKK